MVSRRTEQHAPQAWDGLLSAAADTRGTADQLDRSRKFLGEQGWCGESILPPPAVDRPDLRSSASSTMSTRITLVAGPGSLSSAGLALPALVCCQARSSAASRRVPSSSGCRNIVPKLRSRTMQVFLSSEEYAVSNPTSEGAPDEGRTDSSLLVPSARGLTVPPKAQLEELRLHAAADGTLQNLRQMIAAWEAVAAKCELAFEELFRLAAFRLEVERDLGHHLAQTVKRGGFRTKLPRGTLPGSGSLPEGVSRKHSMLCQQLAAIPDADFRAYLEQCTRRRRLPSAAGARKIVLHSCKTRRPGPSGQLVMPRALIEAMRRLYDVDTLVGETSLPAKHRLDASAPNALVELHGRALVVAKVDMSRWIPELERLRDTGQLQRVVVFATAATWAPWYARLLHTDWMLCFPTRMRFAGCGVLLAHLGEKSAGFRVVMSELGPVIP